MPAPHKRLGMHNLFSYGTLQRKDIQTELFQRTLQGVPDSLRGYHQTTLELPANDGTREQYPVIDHTGDPSDIVEGILFNVTADELKKADAYEGPAYHRIEATLESGRKAWVYRRQVG